VLGESQVDRQESHEQGEEGADQCGRRHAEPEGAGGEGGEEPGHGSHEHDPLDAEVEDAGPLAEDFPQGAEDDGGGHAHHGGEEPGDECNGEYLFHQSFTAFMRYSVRRRAMSITMRAMPWITSAM